VVRASQIFKHPGFDLNNLGMHDIGLVRLATPVTDRAPARVNFDPAKAPVGIAVTMVGYGVTSRSNPNSAGTQRVVDQTSVSCAVGGGSDAALLCFSQVAGKGKCVGDSGGPSFATIDGQQWQVGVTSFGDQNCQQFGADTRTDAEEAFVLEHVPELNPCDADNPCADGRTCFQGTCIADPFSPGGIGSECADGPECESGQCASSSEESLCTFACATGTDGACPDGFECRDTSGGAGGVCWPTDEGGCCSTGKRRRADPRSSAWPRSGCSCAVAAAGRRRAIAALTRRSPRSPPPSAAPATRSRRCPLAPRPRATTRRPAAAEDRPRRSPAPRRSPPRARSRCRG
jgi:hypothetical protein